LKNNKMKGKMMEYSEIKKVILSVVNEYINTLPEDERIVFSEGDPLYGNQSKLDSLSLVNIIVELETVFSEMTGTTISLTDDRAMLREVNPFKTIQHLADYIQELIGK